MSINLIITTPTNFDLSLPKKPTKAQQAVQDAIQSLGVQWPDSSVGTDGTSKLYIVVTRTGDLQGLIDLIKGYGLPIVVKHAQDSQKSLVTNKDGPILDAGGNMQYKVFVYKQATTAELLPFMAPVRTYDKTGKMLSEKPATVVTLPQYGGHEAWQI